jgi:hypothetical protein
MEQLVFIHHWGGEPCGGTSFTPFTYESKDKFVFDMLEKHKNVEWVHFPEWSSSGWVNSDFSTSTVNVLGHDLTKGDLDGIENQVITLQEWFQREEVKIETK